MNVDLYDIHFLELCHWTMRLGWYKGSVSCRCLLMFRLSDFGHLVKLTRKCAEIRYILQKKVDRPKGKTTICTLVESYGSRLTILWIISLQSRVFEQKSDPRIWHRSMTVASVWWRHLDLIYNVSDVIKLSGASGSSGLRLWHHKHDNSMKTKSHG